MERDKLYAPFDLRCEYSKNPLGLEEKNPRLSWKLEHSDRGEKQSGYQVIVSSCLENIEKDIGDVWDTGRVLSSDSVIKYNGLPLESTKTYYWKVRWWDSQERVSSFSNISCFEMGLLNESDWKAKWIGRDSYRYEMIEQKEIPFSRGYTLAWSPLFRKEFKLEREIKKARVYISGLGFYELYINGSRIGDKVLDPGQTDYKKRVLYSTYDVTCNLILGENAIGVVLGNGRYVKDYGYDFPKLIFQLLIEYIDGSRELIISDRTWKTSYGPITLNGIYYGEVYDARNEIPGWDLPHFDDTEWEYAKEVDAPGGKLVSEMLPPIKVTKTLKPVKMTSPKPGVFVYDFGQNFTGWVKLRVKGPEGTEIRIRYAELLGEDGLLNMIPNRGAKATDVYITKGQGLETYEPRFTYHGFRYVEITGYPGVPTLDDIEGCVVHTAVEPTGSITTSNELINQIHKNILWGQLSNLMSVPTDCPQRDERMGWMGDAQLTVEEAIYNFDMITFYKKYLDDIKDAQKEDGSVSDVVPPYWSLYPADPAWGTAYITIAWHLYYYYGEKDVLEKHYDGLKRYIDFLTKLSPDYILRFYKYGDWCPPGSIRPKDFSGELVATWCYYNDTLNFSKIAQVLGNSEDFEKYSKLAEGIKEAFNKKFLKERFYATSPIPELSKEESSTYLETFLKNFPEEQRKEMQELLQHFIASMGFTSQTINSLPLYLDIVPSEKKKDVLDTLINDITELHDYHLDTGIVGTRYIFDVLTDNGYDEIAYRIANQRTYPSWGYMIEEGATTVWERWEKLTSSGMNSHNHIMFGTVDPWFYKALAGIKCLEPGWNKIIIEPHLVKDLRYTHASVNTLKGLVEVDWEKRDDLTIFSISIPVNTEAEFRLPKLYPNFIVSESDKPIWEDGTFYREVSGIFEAKDLEKYLSFKLGSGRYSFKITKR
ncbi:MAG: family 78 glycoside hydrolase catalytic domain [bacterium]